MYSAEVAVCTVVDPFAQREAVHRFAGERAEHEKIERAVQEILRVAAHAPSTRWKEKIRRTSAPGKQGRVSKRLRVDYLA